MYEYHEKGISSPYIWGCAPINMTAAATFAMASSTRTSGRTDAALAQY